MRYLRKHLFSRASPLLALLLLAGCSSASSVLPSALDEGSISTIYPGPLDFENRYLSNVIVFAGADKPTRGCSGVLMNARTILTAGHCVCGRREMAPSDRAMIEKRLAQVMPSEGKPNPARTRAAAQKKRILERVHQVADSSSCLERVSVYVINYLGTSQRFIPSLHEGGMVRPHPRFLSLDDEQDEGLFREADLALVQLKEAVAENFRAIKLPTEEVHTGQPVVMVGYGLGETGYPTTPFGFRHYGESWVSKIEPSASGSTRFTTREQQKASREASRNYEGDSGGGGFSAADDTVLVGIISARSDGEGTIFESIYPQVKWLKAALN